MNDRTVLDIHFITDGNAIYISAHHGVEPDATRMPKLDFTYNRSIFGYVTILWNRRFLSVYFFINIYKKIVPNKSGQLLIDCWTFTVVSLLFAPKIHTQGNLVVSAIVKLDGR
jgi:hypothetical protein